MLTLLRTIGLFILSGILYEGLVGAQSNDKGVTETPSEIIKYIHGGTNEYVGAKGASVVDGGLRLRQSKDKGGLVLFLHDNTYNDWSFEYTISDIDLHFPEQGGVYLWYTKYDQDMGQFRGGDGHFEGLMAGIEFKGMSPEIVYIYNDGDILDEYGNYSLHRDSFEPSRLKGVKDLTVKVILTENNFKVELYDHDRLLYDSFRYVHDHPFKALGVDKRFSITSYYANTSSEKAFKLVKAQLYKRVEGADYDAEKVHALHESSLPYHEHEVNHPNKEMRAFIAQFSHFIEYAKAVLGDVDNPMIAKTSKKIIEKIEEGNDSSFRHTISNKINEMDRRLQLIHKQMSEMHHLIHELESRNSNTSNALPYIVIPIIKGKTVETKQLIIAKATFCVCLFIFSLLIIDFLLSANALRLSESGYKLSIVGLITMKDTYYMRIVLSLLVSSLCLIYYEHLHVPVKDLQNEEEVAKSAFIVENFTYIILAIAVFLLVQLIRSTFITVLGYKMHFSHYKERIEINNKQNDVLYKINCMTGRQMYSDVKEWASWVFNLLTNHKPRLTRSACRHFFDEHDTEEIFEIFDMNSDGSIGVEEFLSVFFGVIREKYFLNEALSQKNTLLGKLNLVLCCFSFPIGIFFASAMLGGALYLKNYVSAVTGAILSLSFVFSSLAGEVFRSLIFIFLIRPFEAGDVLKIDDKIMIVKELGLMYTSYSVQSLTNYIQNTNLMSKSIVNYRLSDIEEKTYNFVFLFDEFKENLESLKEEIGEYLANDAKKYTGSYEMTNYKHLKTNLISVDIIIQFRINFQYIRGVIRNEDVGC